MITKIKNLLILASIFITTPSLATEWRQKPVQCGDLESATQILADHGEVPLLGGLTNIRGPDDKQPFMYPFYLFVNPDTGTFTLLEHHVAGNEVCIIGYGNSINYDMEKLFVPKTNS